MEGLKTIGKVQITQEATPEELNAVKDILEKAGLIVESKGREIWIRVEERKESV